MHTQAHAPKMIVIPEYSSRKRDFFKENGVCSHLQKEVTKGIRQMFWHLWIKIMPSCNCLVCIKIFLTIEELLEQ